MSHIRLTVVLVKDRRAPAWSRSFPAHFSLLGLRLSCHVEILWSASFIFHVAIYIHIIPKLLQRLRNLSATPSPSSDPAVTMPSNQRSSPQVVRTSPSYAASDACVLNYEASSAGDSDDSPPSHRVVLRLSALLGNLAHLFLLHLPLDTTMSAVVDPTEISLCMARVFLGIEATAVLLSLDLEQAIRNKMVLNARKYPVELVKVRAWEECACASYSVQMFARIVVHSTFSFCDVHRENRENTRNILIKQALLNTRDNLRSIYPPPTLLHMAARTYEAA